jgi:ABC-type glycerol-3-phosphate transport system substrate-binding protein
VAYRKDIFDQYKIKVPTSMEEMVEAARQVKKNAGIDGIVARGIPAASTIATGFISGAKSYADGKWHEIDENLNPRFDDPRHVKFVQLWVDMVRESGPANWANMTWYNAMETFAAGQAGMIADADFFAATYEDPTKSKVAGKVGYALIPPGPGGVTYSGLWTWALGMSKATKNKEAAWYFIQWATSARTLLDATIEYRNYNPSRASVMSNAQVQKMMGGWANYLDVVQRNLKTARVGWVPNPERVRLGDIWARALQEVYFKRLSTEEAMKRANAEMESVFKEVGLKK